MSESNGPLKGDDCDHHPGCLFDAMQERDPGGPLFDSPPPDDLAYDACRDSEPLFDCAQCYGKPRGQCPNCGQIGPEDGEPLSDSELDCRYSRDVLVDVLTYHQRADARYCTCGWGVLGASHADHIANVYEDSIRTYDEDADNG
jgi:hypothetical protein